MPVRSTPERSPEEIRINLVELGRLNADRAVLREHDLLDLELRFAQLGFAMPLLGRAALVRLDRLLELVVAALQALHQLLQLRQRLFKAQGGDVGRNGRSGRLILGHPHASEQLPPRSTNTNAGRVLNDASNDSGGILSTATGASKAGGIAPSP